jgi:hypothetical protein
MPRSFVCWPGRGVDVNVPDTAMGNSPLAWASQQGHVEVVDALMEFGADMDMVSLPYRFTPLMLAAMGGHQATVVRLLTAGADIHAATAERQRNALTLAQAGGHQAIAARLTAAGALLPIPPPEPTTLAWPVIDIEGAPDRSSPDQVLRRFILLMTRWEEAAPQNRKTLGDQGWSVIRNESDFCRVPHAEKNVLRAGEQFWQTDRLRSRGGTDRQQHGQRPPRRGCHPQGVDASFAP